MSAIQKVKRYVRNNYGNLITTDEPVFDKTTKTWIVNLKSDYPRIIKDDKTQKPIVRIIVLPKLGTIRLTENLELLEVASRDECVKSLQSRLDLWQTRAEKIVIQASSTQLAKVRGADFLLYPIAMIIDNLLLGESNVKITYEEIEREQRSERMLQYLKLLEDLDIVRSNEEGYTYGNLFTQLLQEVGPDELSRVVLSHVIKERYSTLRDVFDISRFEPYVHADNCYYGPALEAEELIYRDQKTLISDYNAWYGSISPLRIRSILHELVKVDALEQEGSYYLGNERLFSNMLELKETLADLAPPSAGTL